jgi:hypothetical protein
VSEHEWRGSHRPAHPGDADEYTGAPLHALDRVAPDFYDTPARIWNFGGEPEGSASIRRLHGYRGRPDANVTIYRSMPPEHAHKGIQPGDWVALEHRYAAQHGMHADDPTQDWPVVSRQVKVKELWNSGDSFMEFGWHPEES